MASLDRNLRRDLENAVKKARRVAEAGAHDAVDQLAVGHHEPWSALSPEQRKLRNRLRVHGRQLGDKLDEKRGIQSTDRLVRECAYQHWHRLLFARFLAENELLIEPESGMALSLDECRELAHDAGKDWLVLASEFAERMLPQIFRAGDPVLELGLPPEKRQELESILGGLPSEVFTADDSLGWVYQFWQADEKDAVNKSEKKIGAEELPAVTQLFTEDYMVLFLLHNTLGAWWAGKVLAAQPDLARSAASEDELRAACAISVVGAIHESPLHIAWEYLRFVREDDVWRPAAGTFPGWPTAAKDLTVLDPCMGSGHFLAFALPMLVALRCADVGAGLKPAPTVTEAVDAVLRDNLFGLEIDPRCTQIAAFNVGFTAWKLAGYRSLPALNLACSGLGINAPVEAWTALAAGDAPAENAMKQLYELFRQAPTLGSLIDPTRVGGDLFVANFDKIRGLLTSALASEESEDAELAVVAQGVAKAASILVERYSLVITNVPYLARGKQDEVLRRFSEDYYDDAKADLANVFLERCLDLAKPRGTGVVQVVMPQNWLFLTTYKKQRESLLKRTHWNLLVRLGSGAFETISGEVVKAILLTQTNDVVAPDLVLRGLDTANHFSASEKAQHLRCDQPLSVQQGHQLRNPDARITFGEADDLPLLSNYADGLVGLQTGDDPMFVSAFWEQPSIDRDVWEPMQSTPVELNAVAGESWLVRWERGLGRLFSLPSALPKKGAKAVGKRGVAIHRMEVLFPYRFSAERFHQNVAVILPKDEQHLAAIWCFCSSTEYRTAVRRIDSSLKVTNATLVSVPFDLERWQQVAAEQYPNGLPIPHAMDPRQWSYSGQPSESDSPLQVAVARLLGYRWPRQTGSSFMDCPAIGPDGLESHADDDGIVCLPFLRGEAAAAERVRALLSDAFGAEWSAQKLNELVADVGFAGKSLDDWLRDGFFEQHCALFHQRPFIWQVWDGLKNGFSALVNYHKLAAPNGEGRRTLEKLIYTYLGDWLDRRRDDQKAGVEGADGRVAAAEHLRRELEKILEGEPPYDIFVRWKPLHEQSIGWDPDIDDGVRLNIRPFMTAKPLDARGKNACILRVAPKIKWGKDRGKEPTRDKADYPWFWGWDETMQDFMGGKEFDGNRWNDLHYTCAAKRAARERKGGH